MGFETMIGGMATVEPASAWHAIEEQVTVLVVEDDPTLLSTLAFNLRREGYRVLTAADGEAGLALARRELPRLDLVVLDLMLPRLSGLQVLRHLRAESAIPILILSARGEEQDRIDGLELGADDYVVKPFALRELLARVRAGVRRRAVPAAQPPSVLYRGPLRIELKRCPPRDVPNQAVIKQAVIKQKERQGRLWELEGDSPTPPTRQGASGSGVGSTEGQVAPLRQGPYRMQEEDR
jgi:CheY-like chemotaxis protein